MPNLARVLGEKLVKDLKLEMIDIFYVEKNYFLLF